MSKNKDNENIDKQEIALAIDEIYDDNSAMSKLAIIGILSQIEDNKELLNYAQNMLEDIEEGNYNREDYINEEYLKELEKKRGNN